jgi:hypothetical protein
VNVDAPAGLVLATKYPPADDYQKKFWKLLISALESELHDDEAIAQELVSREVPPDSSGFCVVD